MTNRDTGSQICAPTITDSTKKCNESQRTRRFAPRASMEHGEIQLAADSLQEAANMLEVGGALRGLSVVSGPLSVAAKAWSR